MSAPALVATEPTSIIRYVTRNKTLSGVAERIQNMPCRLVRVASVVNPRPVIGERRPPPINRKRAAKPDKKNEKLSRPITPDYVWGRYRPRTWLTGRLVAHGLAPRVPTA